MKYLAVLMLLGALSWGASASAMDLGEGKMNSVSFYPIPQKSDVEVRVLDDSDRNLSLQDTFKAELSAQGYTVKKGAEFILSFQVQDDISTSSITGRRSLIRAEGSTSADADSRVLLNLYDNKRGGVLSLGKGRVETINHGQYRMDVSIDSRKNGKRVWQAWTTGEMTSSDELTLTKAMVPALIQNLGETVKQKSFRLQRK